MEKDEIQTTMTTLINDVRIIVEKRLKKAYQNVNAITVFKQHSGLYIQSISFL